MMETGNKRLGRLHSAMEQEKLDALVCAIPSNVLLLSGYWPVLGTAIAIATMDQTVIAAPEQEMDFAKQGWADEIHTFSPGSLDALTPLTRIVTDLLKDMDVSRRISGGRIGFESGQVFFPSTYAALNVYGAGMPPLLANVCPKSELVPADQLLASERSVLVPGELAQIRKACSIAAEAFRSCARMIRSGLQETELAEIVAAPLRTKGTDMSEVQRAGGYVYCMSGPNSARAFAAFQRSTARHIEDREPILVHCNSYTDGFWTDITRTFYIGEPDPDTISIYQAIQAASEGAIGVVRPGVRASTVDEAARNILKSRGFGKQFKHATGHGVGFAAIDHDALPRIHPLSADLLEPGMVFNVEPAAYFENRYGFRHCSMVVVTEEGAELLTDFQNHVEDLLII